MSTDEEETNEALLARAEEALAVFTKTLAVTHGNYPAINIKVHHDPNVTPRQRAWLDEDNNEEKVRQDMSEEFWDNIQQEADGCNISIQGAGRCGGWIELRTRTWEFDRGVLAEDISQFKRLLANKLTLVEALRLDDHLAIAKPYLQQNLYEIGVQVELAERWNAFCEEVVRPELDSIHSRALHRINYLMKDDGIQVPELHITVVGQLPFEDISKEASLLIDVDSWSYKESHYFVVISGTPATPLSREQLKDLQDNLELILNKTVMVLQTSVVDIPESVTQQAA